MPFDTVLQTIGNTPHIRINKLFGSTFSFFAPTKYG